MNIEWCDKLITALESGKYKHCKNVFRTADNRYCATGVLIDISLPQLWGKEPEEHPEHGLVYHWSYNILSPEYLVWGLSNTEWSLLLSYNNIADDYSQVIEYLKRIKNENK